MTTVSGLSPSDRRALRTSSALVATTSNSAKGAAAFALSLVKHPFLPGEDGSWVEEKRRQLTGVRVEALNVLADSCLRSGEAPETAKWAEQAIDLEPYRETGYRRLMEAHVAAGNRAEALRVYERCRRLLDEELGAYPSPETESVYQVALEAPSAWPGGSGPGATGRGPLRWPLPELKFPVWGRT